MDTLVFGYALPTIRARSGLAPVRVRPCWANQKSAREIPLAPNYYGLSVFIGQQYQKYRTIDSGLIYAIIDDMFGKFTPADSYDEENPFTIDDMI